MTTVSIKSMKVLLDMISVLPHVSLSTGVLKAKIRNREQVRARKLGRTILDISPHDLAQRIFNFLTGSAVVSRLLRSSNRFTAYSSYPIKLKFGRMLLRNQSLGVGSPNFVSVGAVGRTSRNS